jgi:hypothetical protein
MQPVQGAVSLHFFLCSSTRGETLGFAGLTGGDPDAETVEADRGGFMAETAQSGRSTFENFGRKVDAQFGNIGPRIEDEVKRVIGYLNDQVVPQVRQNSSSALRAAAEQLARLADHLDQRRAADAQQAGDKTGA